MLGAEPQDEDPAPSDGDFPPGGPFDFFGFGQPGNGPGFHQHNMAEQNPPAGANGGLPGHGFVDPQDIQENDAQAQEPDNIWAN